jgi:protein-S-isoprenylcysteine O-methyltransferase Ste14
MSRKMQKIKNDPDIRRNVIRRLIQIVVVFFAMYGILCLSAGTLTWIWGLVYFALNTILLAINWCVLPLELIAERGAKKDGVKKWDKIITTLSLIPYLGVFVIVGLDYRYGWSGDLGIIVHMAGVILFILGSALFTWAMVSNKFFSTEVRIQLDRDHKVETEGPYRYVRHPGYVGYIIFTLAVPLIFSSWWGLLLAGFGAILIIIRTALEDATLIRELAGYKDFAKKVRYRLITGIW